jgi:hypothetical protein
VVARLSWTNLINLHSSIFTFMVTKISSRLWLLYNSLFFRFVYFLSTAGSCEWSLPGSSQGTCRWGNPGSGRGRRNVMARLLYLQLSACKPCLRVERRRQPHYNERKTSGHSSSVPATSTSPRWARSSTKRTSFCSSSMCSRLKSSSERPRLIVGDASSGTASGTSSLSGAGWQGTAG